MTGRMTRQSKASSQGLWGLIRGSRPDSKEEKGMTRGRTIAVLSILALVVGIVLGALPVQAARGFGGDKAVQPATNVGINYPAFPVTNAGTTPYPIVTGGPYIVAATARPATIGDAAANVLVVFNEDLSVGTVLPSDFVATGFTFGGATVSGNTVMLTGVANAGAGDGIRLANPQAVAGSDLTLSSDVSTTTLGTGPVITGVAFASLAAGGGYGDSTASNDRLVVTFDDDIVYSTSRTANTAFAGTPEFNFVLPGNDQLLSTVATNTITIYKAAAPTNYWRWINAGVTKLQMAAGQVQWADVATTNSLAQSFVVANNRPFVKAVYYNGMNSAATGDDEIWVVMSEPINPTTFGAAIATDFNTDTDGGSFVIAAGLGSVTSPFATDFSSVLKLTALPVGGTIPDEADDFFGALDGALADYQGSTSVIDSVRILLGPGITRASFDDRRSLARSDDQLYIWFNENVATPANIAIGDFTFLGFTSSGLSLTTDLAGTVRRVTISGFTATNYPLPGSRVQLKTGTGIVGTTSNLDARGSDENGAAPKILIEDESRPYTLVMNENDSYTYDRWNAALGIDSVFVAWAETGTDDSDQYFAFFTKENPATVDAAWMNSHLPTAIALGNLRPGVSDGLIRVGFLVDPSEGAPATGAITQSVDAVSPDLAEGDQLYILVASADYQGNLSLRFDSGSAANHIFGAFLVGPLCAPRDFINAASVPSEPDSVDWDDDVIHVVGDTTDIGIQYFVYGDPGAIPCSGDSVVVYRTQAGPLVSANRLGAGPIAADGSFTYIELDSTIVNANPTDAYIYLRTKTGIDISEPTKIIFDREYPYVRANAATPYADFIFDPFNPYRVYNAGDYVNLRLLATDAFQDSVGGVATNLNAKSALLHIWADFTRLDGTAGNITGFGTPADSIELVSLGADGVDNDGDWLTFTDSNADGNWDAGEPLNNDVGIDGVAGTNDLGEGDGLPTAGDPYVDENGNGSYDAGETFLDRVNKRGTRVFAIRDPGEPNLDSQDAEEFGWYELRNSDALVPKVPASTHNNTCGTVKQGYLLANPNIDGRLWPYSPIQIWLEDNGIQRSGSGLASMPNYVNRALPYMDTVAANTEPQGYCRNLSHVTTHLGTDAAAWDPERTFRAQIDLKTPTVAEVDSLQKQSGAASTAAANEILPGNPTYHLGRFFDFQVSTLSDWDVLYNRAQIKVGATWRDLNMDPSLASGAANDGNADGSPGSLGYDEDNDGLEDFADLHVIAAAIDSTQNAALSSPGAIDCMNDRRDNDNDAFFVYDSYAGGGLAGATNIGKITWYNIDESLTNNFDDDNDGTADESDEVPENVGYGTGVNDDNEDGIVNGEAVAVTINNGFSKLAGVEALADGYSNFRAAAASVAANTIYVDAAHIFGTRPLAGNDAPNAPFYFNNVAYPEPVPAAFEILTNSNRLFTTDGYDLNGDTDSTATQHFGWFATHGENLDMELMQKIHGLVADGTTVYQLRTLAYDKAGNMATAWTEPISFTIDLTGPAAAIPGCNATGTPPVDFADVSALAGVQIWDSGKHPGQYTLTATAGADAASVTFFASTSPVIADILASPLSTDNNAPYTAKWPAGFMFAMDNYPYNHQQTWYFLASAVDAFGNATPEAGLCVFQATVLDGTAPTICLSQVDNDADLRDGATAPPDSSINVYVYQQTAPLPGRFDDNDGIEWCGGLDRLPGVAGQDDDGDGTTDEVNFGPDGIAGTNDDEWNGSNADGTDPNHLFTGSGNLGETDDYRTNDIVKVVFQMNPIADNPDLGWITFATVHGDTNSVPGQVIDWTEPVKATWNTWGLATGDYDLRAWGVDWEGNSNELTACITTVGIRSNPLRAYVQPAVCTGPLDYDLYAVHYIHDYEIDKVRFEYYFDANGDSCANDAGSTWSLIGIDDGTNGDPRGDAVLYPPANQIESSDPIEGIGYQTFGQTHYMYWDADGDGYSPRDPVVLEDEDKAYGVFNDADDDVVIGANVTIPEGATLTAFASDEFWAETSGEVNGLEPTDWIFRQNAMNAAASIGTGLNLWSYPWDATGLPEGNYLTRTIAIDENNITDVISYTCFAPNMQNPEEIELVRVDTQLPNTNIVTLTLPDASAIDVSAMSVPPYINGNTKWIKIAATGDADTQRMLFEYSLNGGVSWVTLDVNNDDDFYADLNGTSGWQVATPGALFNDEIFNDLNGNYTFDPGVDFVRFDGGDGVVDTPRGWPLRPLVGEDPNGGAPADLDGDGQIDEDPPVGTVQTPTATVPGNPQDYTAPYAVYLDISTLTLLSDVNILFRGTAYDLVCGNSYRPDPTPDVLAVIIGENQQPEADVIRVEDLDGVELDTRPAIMDADGVDTFGADLDSARVYVTAEDVSSLAAVDLFYRLDPACYLAIPEDQQQRPTDLALVLDGSASITPASFTLQKEGVAAALADAGIIPADGTVSLTVVQFGNGVGVTQIPRTLITSPTVAATLATQVLAIVQLLDGTPTSAGINQAVVALGAGTPGARQVIIIATDGLPTDPEPQSAAEAAALAAADAAIAAGVEELHALGIGTGVNMTFLSQLVRHGGAEQISSYSGFAAAIGSKIQSIIFNTLLEMRQWKSMTADGLIGPPGIDTTYPYDFNIATDLIADGVYQYYPRAYDANGTFNEAPINPWGFKKFALAGVDFAYVSTPAGPPAAPDSATAASGNQAGDEYVIHASLRDPLQAPTTAVRFYYAQRILDEVVNADEVQPMLPFTAPALAHGVTSNTPGDGVVVKINGTLGTYHTSLAGLAAPTKFDFTMNGSQVVFGARPASTDDILVSYNFGSWSQIDTGDSWSPYTVAWSQANGGVPEPANVDTDAYDLAAVALYDLNNDGVYGTACDYTEPLASEGNYLYLRDEARPEVILYGLAYDDFVLPFDYLDWNWPGNPLFRAGDELHGPNFENKLSGNETDVFVDATDTGGGEVASVTLDITASAIAGTQVQKTTIDMTKISRDTEFIDIPITFYEDDYYAYWITGYGPFNLDEPGKVRAPITPSWESAAIENVVLQISVDDGQTWTRQYLMTHDATNRTWTATGRFNTGIVNETQLYQFVVDLVGDQQAVMPDARNLGRTEIAPKADDAPAVVYYSALNVPSTSNHAFWYTHLDNATQLRNNAFHRVVVTATDTFGNTGTNLTSTMPGAKSADAQGPIVFVLDQTPPVVNSIVALNGDDQPLAITRVSPSITYNLMADVSDYPFTDVNVMSTLGVIYQYSPNNWAGNPDPTWISISQLGWALNGMWVADWTPESPLSDGYDNDGDGVWDEPDEAVASVTIRAIAFDDGFNSGYSDRQATPVTLTLIVDAAEPSAALTQPVDGEVFGYSEPILLSGTAIGDYIPALATNDIDRIRFQAKINRFFYIDQVYNGVGQTAVYDNGIDEVWFDVDGSGTWNAADNVTAGKKFAGQDGTFSTPSGTPAIKDWFDLDATPQDNRDNPWLTDANNGSNWEITWTPSGFSFVTVDQLGGDEYVRLRMLSRDTAGNWDTEDDLLGPMETVVILNDDSVTRAYVTHVNTNDQDGAVDPAETKPVQGLNPINVYGSLQAAGSDEVVQVNVYMVRHPEAASPDTVFVAMDNGLQGNAFTVLWDSNRSWVDGTTESPLADGEEVLLFATAVDVDQNETSGAEATKVRVRIDRTPPVVNYVPLGTYAGFTTAASYTDDGIVNHSSMVITPDFYTGDVNFTVTTTADDIPENSMVLQWRWASDPVGLWRPVSEFFSPTVKANGVFDAEPNQDFDEAGVPQHVWWLHLENFANVNLLHQTGRMEFRALTTDEAGNSNALQTEVAAYTADNTEPTGFDWNDDTVSNQIEVGTTVNFEIAVQDGPMADSTRTDITSVALFVRKVGSAWPTAPYATVVPDPSQIDTGNAMWIARFGWTAPAFVVHDTQYEFGVVMMDAAGNVNSVPWQRPGYAITVEDNAAPDRTKMVDVVALVLTSAEEDKSVEDPFVWKNLDNNNDFDLGTDWLISEGSDLHPPVDPINVQSVGDECATFPRNVGESFLNDAQVRNTVKVARTVTLVGRTQSDDDGIGQMDTGIQWVTFLLAPCDANGVLSAQSEWITLGRDEYAPAFPLFYWHLTLNTELYADGTYKLGVYAMDEEGNVEDMTTLDWTSAIIVIDNESPSAQMDADATTDAVEKTATVERNRPFTLFARTLVPATATLENYEDDTVEFFYKRARDLNMADSWKSVPDSAGVVWDDEYEDGNPDETRPYSFDVGMGRLFEPTDNHTDVPLSVGEAYDFATAVGDEVCNTTSQIQTFADSSVAGVGTRYVRLLIQDTIAPHLEFTSAGRAAAPYGDEDTIENPTKVHAQGFHWIEAKLLTGDLDMDHAEFVYRPMGTTTWNLIDAVLTASDENRTWELGDWDLQTLQHNTWYEVACIGVDNVGNVDQNPDIMEVYVDYEAPPFTLVSPAPATSVWCNGLMDLIVQVERGTLQQHDDVYDVIWQWKDSTWPDQVAVDNDDPDSQGWHTLGVATDADLYDDATNKYSNTLNLDGEVDMDPGSGVDMHDIFHSDIFDLRVTVVDEAGNVRVYDVYKNTVDLDDPNYAQISNIKLDGDDTTQDPSDGTHPADQFTDVTAGTMVEIFGTASDNEPALPDAVDPQTGVFYETMIAAMQFQVAFDLNGDGAADGATWHDIGVVKLDPPTLGDMSAQTSSILWNTTGLPEGEYLLRVIAIDACGLSTISGAVNVRVLDWTPPIARIVAWDADQQPHGTPAPSLVTIYALAECDTTDARPDSAGWQPTYDLQMQYNVKDVNETVPTGDWVNIGIAEPMDIGNRYTTEHIWAATINPELFGDNVTSVWLRALVKDDMGNRYGDDPEDVIPTIQATVVRAVDDLGVEDGTITLQQVPSAELQGGSEMVESVSIMVESPTHVIVTAKMAVADQMPRVILLWEPSEPDASEYPSYDNPENLSPGTEGGLVRSLDDPTVWRGEFFTQGSECNLYGIWVTGLDGTVATAKWIDLKEAYFREFPVTTALGTNGTVVTPAYVNLGSKVSVPSGSWQGSDACLIVSPTEPPITSRDQERYMLPIEKTAYHLELQAGPLAFTHGYEPLVTFKYSNDLALAALAQTEGATENNLTVRRWNPATPNRDGTTGAWVGTGLTHIKAYPDNNEVVFRVDNLTSPLNLNKDVFAASDSSAGNVFQLFAPKQTAPVLVSNIWPSSPYVTSWVTDADPVIVVYLRDPAGQMVDPNEVELLIDGEYWATWLDGEGSAEFIRGNGAAWLEYTNQDQTVMELVYHHSTFPRDWLTNGAHKLTVRYKALNGTDDWMEMKDEAFSVDRKSPYIEFDGGFVSNPNLSNVFGYMNPQRGNLVARLYDAGMGILFKHDRPWYYADLDCDGVLNPNERQFDPVPYPDSTWMDPGMRGVNCWMQADWGIKYDVWRIHTPDHQPPHDHQNDIDNIEVRTLLHQGTANDLEPWIMQNGARITLDQYNPADTLVVPMPVMGGGVIQDNDIVEITWYSDKSIEQNSDGPGFGCIVDTVVVNGTLRLFWDPRCAYDSESQEMHIYNEGIQDWASNSGSKYVEQRFIVDMSCPNIAIVQPATTTVDPAGNMQIEVTFADAGVGVNPLTVSVTILDPSGNLAVIGSPNFINGRFTGVLVGPLQRGEYTIKATAADLLGAACERIQIVKVEALVLAMTEAVAAPNPFNPAEGTSKIHFNLSKAGDVTVRIYDFAGLEVATLASMEHMPAGMNHIDWAGEAADHTDLANGAYICRITASDGAKTEEQNLKVVIWRE